MVIALDKYHRPMGFVTERRARKLLDAKRACVVNRYPFTIVVKDVNKNNFEKQRTFRVKIDPGSKGTGIAVIDNETNQVCLETDFVHRGDQIKDALYTRRGVRRNRRNRETRYRKSKYGDASHPVGKNHNKYTLPSKEGWLPPSVKSTADNTINWVKKLMRWINITDITVESVKFDMQLLDNPDIEGMEYQHGELFGYTLKEYLLEKYGHTCQYCGGEAKDPVLEWEHMISVRNGGTNSVKNAALACNKCNDAKGSLNLDQWLNELKAKPKRSNLDEIRIKRIESFLEGKPLVPKNYGAWVNSTRNYLLEELNKLCPNIETGTGAQTKYNRTQLGLPKEHYFDALCAGTVPEGGYKNVKQKVLVVEAKGHGNRLRGNINSCGVITNKFYNRHHKYFRKIDKKTGKEYRFQTGDLVKAVVPDGQHAGTYIGRISIRKKGQFVITVPESQKSNGKTKLSVWYKHCTVLKHSDGYNYYYE